MASCSAEDVVAELSRGACAGCATGWAARVRLVLGAVGLGPDEPAGMTGVRGHFPAFGPRPVGLGLWPAPRAWKWSGLAAGAAGILGPVVADRVPRSWVAALAP